MQLSWTLVPWIHPDDQPQKFSVDIKSSLVVKLILLFSIAISCSLKVGFNGIFAYTYLKSNSRAIRPLLFLSQKYFSLNIRELSSPAMVSRAILAWSSWVVCIRWHPLYIMITLRREAFVSNRIRAGIILKRLQLEHLILSYIITTIRLCGVWPSSPSSYIWSPIVIGWSQSRVQNSNWWICLQICFQ